LDIAIILCLCKAKNLVIALVLSIFFNEADAQNNQFISGILVLYWYKRLLYALSVNVPFTPNISKLSEKIDISRNALVQALQLLSNAELIQILFNQARSTSILNKPDKI